MKNQFKIFDRVITSDSPTLIIAEIGINHLGDEGLCEKMILSAIESGADCIKLQTGNIEESFHPNNISYSAFKGSELSKDSLNNLSKLAKDNGITDEAALALIEAQAYPHFLDVMALLFILNVAIMLLIGKLYPRKEEFIQEHTKQVDITPWKYTTQAGIAICVIVIGIYIYFA